MHDKKNIWMPFNSVVNSKEMLDSVMAKRKKIKKPILSEDDKQILNQKLIEYFYEKEKVKLEYFYNGEIHYMEDYIKKIDSVYHKVYFINKIILFEQILKIY